MNEKFPLPNLKCGFLSTNLSLDFNDCPGCYTVIIISYKLSQVPSTLCQAPAEGVEAETGSGVEALGIPSAALKDFLFAGLMPFRAAGDLIPAPLFQQIPPLILAMLAI